jgi:hypothetical protein
MHKPQSLFYLTTALRVSGATITHLQEHKTTVTTASGNHYTVLLSTAAGRVGIGLRVLWVAYKTSSNSSTTAADNSTV